MSASLLEWFHGDGGPRPKPPGAWSVSRVLTAAKCLRKYGQRYKDESDEDEDVDSSGADLGSAVHDALERAYLWVEAEQYAGAFPKRIARALLGDVMLARKMREPEMYMRARKMIDRHSDQQIDVDWMSLAGVECGFLLDLGDERTLVGFMDRVEFAAPDGRRSSDDITVHDYKTGKWLPTDVALEHDLQSSVYMLAASLKWPGKRIHFVFDYLEHGVRLVREFDAHASSAALDYVRMIIRSAEGVRTGDDVPGTIHAMCPWCEYSSGCREYQAALASPVQLAPTKRMDQARLILEYESASATASIARQRAQKIGTLLKQPILAAGKRRKEILKALEKGRKDAKKKGAEDIEEHARRHAASALGMREHEIGKALASDSLRAGGFVARIAKQRRPSRATYPLDDVCRALEDLGICAADEARGKLAIADHAKLSRLITARTAGWRDADREAARARIESLAKMAYESYLDIREDRDA